MIKSTAKKSVSLSYAPPMDNGGSPVTSYEVEYRIEGQSKWTKVTKDTITALDYTVTGLNANGVYEFRIAAVNKAGVGPASDSSKPAAA